MSRGQSTCLPTQLAGVRGVITGFRDADATLPAPAGERVADRGAAGTGRTGATTATCGVAAAGGAGGGGRAAAAAFSASLAPTASI
jgi:hypothetical protein